VVLEKDREDQFDQSCEKLRSVTKSQGGEEYPTNNLKKKWKTKWFGHIMCRNCLLIHIIEGQMEGRIEVMRRQGRRPKQLLDDLMEKREYFKLKNEALDHSLQRTHFRRGYGPVITPTTE